MTATDDPQPLNREALLYALRLVAAEQPQFLRIGPHPEFVAELLAKAYDHRLHVLQETP